MHPSRRASLVENMEARGYEGEGEEEDGRKNEDGGSGRKGGRDFGSRLDEEADDA
jgi:hypothetical protein